MIEYYARFESYIIRQGKNTIFLPSILYTHIENCNCNQHFVECVFHNRIFFILKKSKI